MTTSLEDFLDLQLTTLKNSGLYNEINPLDKENGPFISIDGKSLINLSSNNYLGLVTDERLKQASQKATSLYGVGAGAVRTINGTLKIHDELEKAIAKFKGTEAALVFQSGFNWML